MKLWTVVRHPVQTGVQLHQAAEARKQLAEHQILLDEAIRGVIKYYGGDEYDDEKVMLCWFRGTIDTAAAYWWDELLEEWQTVFSYRISTTGQFGEARIYRPGEWEEYIFTLQCELGIQTSEQRRLTTYYPPADQDFIAQALYIVEHHAQDEPEAYQVAAVRRGQVKTCYYRGECFELRHSVIELKRRPTGYYLEIIALDEISGAERVLQAVKEADRWVLMGTCRLGEWCTQLADVYEFYRVM